MSEPRTVVGKALMSWIKPGRNREWWADRLAAVEAEAATLATAPIDEAATIRAAAATIHARRREPDPDAHPDTDGGPCAECEETGRQVVRALAEMRPAQIR